MLQKAKELRYFFNTGVDPGFLEGGFRIRDGPKREELTLVLHL